MKKGLLRYVLLGVVFTAISLVFFAVFSMLIRPDKTFADGFKSILDWVLAACVGCSGAYSLWKKDNKGSGKE